MIERTPIKRARTKRGQVVLVVLLAFIAILFLALMQVDAFLSIRRRDQTQNGGDAAALAAARWQANTLNMIGELNLIHALAAVEGEKEAIPGIVTLQQRLAFTGPTMGLLAAQVAAKQNHMFVDEDMTGLVKEHIDEIRGIYAGGTSGYPAYPEPWEGAWNEYADMVHAASRDGIAAGPGNADYFSAIGGHLLLQQDFYFAVRGCDWCWFHFGHMDLLRGYRDHNDWGALPPPDKNHFDNGEFFGVDVRLRELALQTKISDKDVSFYAMQYGYDIAETNLVESGVTTNALEKWMFYGDTWTKWDAIDPFGEEQFPVVGPVKEEYDVDGAAAVCRVTGEVKAVSPSGADHTTVWSAAAKPFGYLDTPQGKDRVTAAAGLVIPAFTEARLIPLDAAHGASMNSADAEWVHHIRWHLEKYISEGWTSSQCSYCRDLRCFDNELFRQTGIEWLKLYSGRCRRPTGGRGSRGGSHHGH